MKMTKSVKNHSSKIKSKTKPEKQKRQHIRYEDFVASEFKRDSEFLKSCIKSAFENYKKDEQVYFLLETLRQAAEAKGIAKLAEETGLSRQYIYEMLSKKGNPTVKVFEVVLRAFGYRMTFQPIKKSSAV